ncbi:MAG: DUF5654 family protein [Candidatus Pacearchaeota archaeon]
MGKLRIKNKDSDNLSRDNFYIENAGKNIEKSIKNVPAQIYSLVAGKTKSSVKKFNEELSKAMNSAIIGAFSFLIALAWRDLIAEYVDKVSKSAPVQGKFISALLVTVVCVIGIVIVTSIFSRKE